MGRMEWSIIAIFLVLTLAVIAFVASPAEAGTFYRWVTPEGTVSFTDDLERIPAAYANEAEVVIPAPFNFTQIEVLPRETTDRAEIPSGPEETADCGTVILRTERRQNGDHNSTFFVAEDDCGLLYDSTMFPSTLVGR